MAEATIAELESRLLPARQAVLVESAAPVVADVRELVDRLATAYSVLCSMGAIAGSFPRSVKGILLALTDGTVHLEASAQQDAIAIWSANLVALEADPHALVTLPSAEPAAENPPQSFVRSVLKRARLVCEEIK